MTRDALKTGQRWKDKDKRFHRIVEITLLSKTHVCYITVEGGITSKGSLKKPKEIVRERSKFLKAFRLCTVYT